MKTKATQHLPLLLLAGIAATGIFRAGDTAQAAPGISVEQPPGTRLSGVVAWGLNNFGQTTVPVVALSNVMAIAAGDYHTVALKGDGSVIVWGNNEYNQTNVPVAARSNVTAIAAGLAHTLAVKSDGSVVAWGYNGNGQTTVPVAAQTSVVAVAAGGEHSVALKNDGSVIAWGLNSYGQRTVPAAAQTNVTAIAAGSAHTVALKGDGSVLAWGQNIQGQTNVPVAAQTNVIAIAAGGNHTVALKSDGTVVAWGFNSSGQTDVPAAAQSNVIAIAAGGNHTVALKSDGSVIAWGNNSSGQTNVPAAAQSGVIGIAAGGSSTVALKTALFPVDFGTQLVATASAPKTFQINNTGDTPLDLARVCVTNGYSGMFTVNTSGMLTNVPAGSNTTFTVTFNPTFPGPRRTTLRIVRNDPTQSSFDITLTGTGIAPRISVEEPIASLLSGGLTWGDNSGGQTNAPGIARSNVIALAGGGFHSLALKSDGHIIGWGVNNWGQANVPLAAQSNVTAISAGIYHSLALKSDGSAVSWGSLSGVPLAAQSNVMAISAGYSHNVALKSDGSVVAWGANNWGETDVPPAAQSNVTAISAGGRFSVALKSDGSVLAWGDNSDGQTTVPAAAQSDVVAISAGGYATLALKSDGSVVAWGDSENDAIYVPTAAQSGVVAIACGGYHAAALKSDGSVIAWGHNTEGQTSVPAAAQSGVAAIAAGFLHTLALKRDLLPVDFGTLFLPAGSAARTFRINNTGTAPLNLTSISVTGGNPGDFTVDTSATLTNVPPGSNTTVAVSFTPLAPGTRQTTLRIVNDDPNQSAFDIALTGTGITPEISVQQPAGNALLDGISTVDFGWINVASSSAARTFTITNSGNTSLNLGPITLDGVGAGDFVVNTNSLLTAVAPNSSTTLTVTFSPVAGGTRTAVLHLANDDLDENPFDIHLTGFSYYTQAQFETNYFAGHTSGVTAGIGTVTNNPNAYDLYTTNQVQDLNLGRLLIQRSTNGFFTLIIGLQKGTNLAVPFVDFPLNAPGSTAVINGEGKLEFQFPAPDNAAFFRLESR